MFPTLSAVLIRVRLFLLVGCNLSLKSAERISEESLMSSGGPSEDDGRGVDLLRCMDCAPKPLLD